MTRFKPKIYISIPERPVDKKLSDIQIELLRCYKIIEQAEKMAEHYNDCAFKDVTRLMDYESKYIPDYGMAFDFLEMLEKK